MLLFTLMSKSYMGWALPVILCKQVNYLQAKVNFSNVNSFKNSELIII